MTACTPLLHKETVSNMNHVMSQVIILWVLQKYSMRPTNTMSVFRRLVQYLGPMAIDQWKLINVNGQSCEARMYFGCLCGITKKFVEYMPQQLVDIDMSGYSGLTNRMLKTIGKRCSQLHKVNLSNCTKIRNSSIAVLMAHNCKQLCDINLCGCCLVTYIGVQQIVKLGRCSIEYLGLAYCTKLTSGDIKNVINDRSSKLKYLDIRGLNPRVQDICGVVWNGLQIRLSFDKVQLVERKGRVWRMNHNLLLFPEVGVKLSWKEQKIMNLANRRLRFSSDIEEDKLWKDLTHDIMKQFVICIIQTLTRANIPTDNHEVDALMEMYSDSDDLTLNASLESIEEVCPSARVKLLFAFPPMARGVFP